MLDGSYIRVVETVKVQSNVQCSKHGLCMIFFIDQAIVRGFTLRELAMFYKVLLFKFLDSVIQLGPLSQ